MNTYLISYDLISPGQKYTELGKIIRSFPNWAKVLESTWIVKSPLTCKEVRDKLLAALDSNDKLLVISASAPAAWTTSIEDEVSNWLKKNL